MSHLQKCKIVLIILLSIWDGFLFCQVLENDPEPIGAQFSINSTTPPTPTAASLLKVNDFSMSLYTGQPTISIPLWNVKSRQLTIPISLVYSAKGVKVEDYSGWVGMGWSLNAGGLFSRVKFGLPDEEQTRGFLENYDKIYYGNLTEMDLTNTTIGQLDCEYDIFSYSFAGHSGNLVLGNLNGELSMVHTPCQNNNWRITLNNQSGPPSGYINSWEVTTDDGTSYIFGSDGSRESRETIQIFTDCNIYTDHTSSWYLLKIISPSKGDTIQFYYDNFSQCYTMPLSETKEHILGMSSPCPSGIIKDIGCEAEYTNNLKILSKIETASTIVKFKSKDSNGEIAPILDSIIIQDKFLGRNIRKFHFKYSTITSDHFNLNLWFSCQDWHRIRIWLDEVEEISDEGIQSYKMNYLNREGLPAKISCYIDHWGFLNEGSVGNDNTYVPEMMVNGELLTGANRDPSAELVKTGMLTKITYPTKGYLELEWESHDFSETKDDTVFSPQYYNHSVTARDTAGQPIDTTFKDFYIQFAQGVNLTIAYSDPIGGDECAESSVGIYNEEGEIVYFDGEHGCYSFSDEVVLEEGSYKLFAHAHGMTGVIAWIKADYHSMDTIFNIHNTPYIAIGGGVRLKSKKVNDGNSEEIVNYSYRNLENPLKSSGALIGNYPNYGYSVFQILSNTCAITKFVRTSKSKSPFGTTYGSHVGYREVTETFGQEGQNGRIEHKFYFANDMGRSELFPWPNSINTDYRRGQEVETLVFDKDGILRQKTSFEYENLEDYYGASNYSFVKGLKVGLIQTVPTWPYFFLCFKTQYYHTPTAFNYLKNKTIYTFNAEGENPIISSTEYTYNLDHMRLKSTLTTNSDGNQTIEENKYPQDFLNSGQSGGDPFAYAITLMRDKYNILNSIIEKLRIVKQPNSDEKIISGTLTKFKKFGTYQILPAEVIQLELNAPLSKNDYTETTIDNSGNFVFDSRYGYKRITYDLYDIYSNVLQIHDGYEMPFSINWDYNGVYPVTKAENALYDPTNVYSGPNKLVTRYDYSPLIGPIEFKDPTNISIFYEYDDFGRLRLIRNHDGNIIQKVKYHYKTY